MTHLSIRTLQVIPLTNLRGRPAIHVEISARCTRPYLAMPTPPWDPRRRQPGHCLIDSKPLASLSLRANMRSKIIRNPTYKMTRTRSPLHQHGLSNGGLGPIREELPDSGVTDLILSEACHTRIYSLKGFQSNPCSQLTLST